MLHGLETFEDLKLTLQEYYDARMRFCFLDYTDRTACSQDLRFANAMEGYRGAKLTVDNAVESKVDALTALAELTLMIGKNSMLSRNVAGSAPNNVDHSPFSCMARRLSYNKQSCTYCLKSGHGKYVCGKKQPGGINCLFCKNKWHDESNSWPKQRSQGGQDPPNSKNLKVL